MNSVQEARSQGPKGLFKKLGFKRKRSSKPNLEGMSKKDVKKSDIDKNVIMGQNILVEPHLLLKYD